MEKSKNDERNYRHLTLENELQVLLVSDSETDKASACLDTKVGSLADPKDTQGIAHFLEHMLFMGTKKYPDENDYNKFLSSHGGMSNAYTDSEDTVYFFDVNQEHLAGALDRFAQFFIAPLFTQSATDRELNAVNSENSKNQQTDVWREMQLKKSLSRPDHPFHNFGTGNLATLRDGPRDANIDLRARLLDFHATHYSSNLMRLVIIGRESLDVLETMATTCFQDAANKQIERPIYEENPYRAEDLGKRLSVVPIKDARKIEMTWLLPPVQNKYESKPANYLSHLIGHEGKGSILSLLKQKGWANGFSSGLFASGTCFSIFGVQIDCTDEGIENADFVVSVVYQYLAMLRNEGPHEWIFNESRDIAAINFLFQSKSRPIDYSVSCATSMQIYPPERTLTGSSKLPRTHEIFCG